MKSFRRHLLPLLALGLGFLPSVGRAALVTASGTIGGFDVSASADFEVVGNALQITLTNTAGSVNSPSQVLSNIEFNLNSGVVFDADTSSVSASSLADNGSTIPGSTGADISGGYGVGTNVTYPGVSGTRQFGVSSVSFVNSNTQAPIGGAYLPGFGGGHPNSLDGVDYGIVATASDTGSGGLSNQGPLVTNSVVITLALASGSAAIDLTKLSGVAFSYGSEQTGVPGGSITVNETPEPASFVTAGLGVILGLGYAWRRKRAAA